MYQEATDAQCGSADIRHTQRGVGAITQKLHQHSGGLYDTASDRCR